MSENRQLEDFKQSICDDGCQPPKSNAAPSTGAHLHQQQHQVLHHLSCEMYDKILRHRHAIEAHLLAFDYEVELDEANNGPPKIDLDPQENQLILSAPNAGDLVKANQVIEHILNSPKGDLGLTGLTSEALMAKMSLNENKVPLGSASSWDPAVRRKRDMEEAKRLLMTSALPPELSFAPQPTLEDWLVVPRHANVTRAASDSYVKYMSRMVNIQDNRRKLESEDSSYGSDHDNGGHAREDVSRTASETLAAEYPDYCEVNDIEAIRQDKNYEAKVLFALKLGYEKEQLEKAVMKLGAKAGNDQILEELIRLQKAKPMLDHHLVQDHVAIKKDLIKDLDHHSNDQDNLLPIVIDGSNVAMAHGKKAVFSCKGIQICVDWFKNHGHEPIRVFVPSWRKESSKPDSPITDQAILFDLEKEGVVVFTPSKTVNGRRYNCHDDRYVLNLASENGGIVVSNDNFRELINEKNFKEVIEKRILMYTFVDDSFMPPDDPLGRNGPTLEQFLRKKAKVSTQQPCPYGKKCTYGNKCKYWHPDRANNQKSVIEQLQANSSQRISDWAKNSRDSSPGDPLHRTKSMQPSRMSCNAKQPVMRTKSLVPNWSTCPPPVMTDTSMPPPPPRTPWVDSQVVNSHARLSRQLSVNPTYDPRIHHGLTQQQPKPAPPQDFSRPPPPVPRHMTVSRNASAPVENPNVPLYPSSGPNVYVEQPPVSNSDSQLHKTWSSPPVAPSDVQATANAGPVFQSGIWDSQRSLASGAQDRSKLYFHLANLFPEDKVIRAMNAMPSETNPEVICQFICSEK